MIYPMAALVLLTFAIALTMLKERILAVHRREVPLHYFKNYDIAPAELPSRMVLAERCFNNLLEVPPLFYSACLAALILPVDGPGMIALAWLYVACRLAQAIIHLGSNKVFWRMRVFLLGNVTLLAMWGYLVLAYSLTSPPH